MAVGKDAAADHCQRLVRQADKDRYLASLFAPDVLRPHVQALYAFNIELARVREAVSDPALGEFRLQWWRDSIEGIYAGPVPEAPVAQALARAVEHADLPKYAFVNMIEARRFDLYDDPMPDLGTLEGYLGETSSTLIQLASLVLAGADALGAATASGYAGVAFGLTGLLRSLPVHRARGQCYVPVELLARRGTAPSHLLSGRLDTALGLVLGELRHHALVRLGQARAHRGTVPPKALPAFLPTSLTDLYCRKLARRGLNPLKSVADVSQVRKQLRLLSRAYAGKF